MILISFKIYTNYNGSYAVTIIELEVGFISLN